MNVVTRSAIERPEISLSELLSFLRQRRWAITIFVIASTLAGTVYGLLRTPTYTASILVAPVSSYTGGGIGGSGSMLSEFSGLASLAGIATQTDTKKAESVAVLKSQALTDKFIEQNNLLPKLFAGRSDASGGESPTVWSAYQYFNKKVRTVAEDPKTGLITLTISWTDPHLAADWANELVALTNEYLRDQAIQESERNIAFLNAQAEKTDVLPLKQEIYSLLKVEISKEMLAQGNSEYAFKILDPALAPGKPSSPPPIFWLLLGLVGSFALSVFAAFVRVAWLAD